MSDTGTVVAGKATVDTADGRPLRYRRILLKLSGEALLGDRPYGVDPAFCAFVARQVAELHALGVQVGIVVGGGNIFRGLAAASVLLLASGMGVALFLFLSPAAPRTDPVGEPPEATPIPAELVSAIRNADERAIRQWLDACRLDRRHLQGHQG